MIDKGPWLVENQHSPLTPFSTEVQLRPFHLGGVAGSGRLEKYGFDPSPIGLVLSFLAVFEGAF